MIDRRQIARLATVIVVLAAAFIGLGMRMTFLHLGPTGDLRDRVTKARVVEKPILVGRGRILDRKGTILAMDLTVYDVNADPTAITTNGLARSVAAFLARTLDLDPGEVQEKLARAGRQQVYIKKGLHEDEMMRLKALKLPFVWCTPVSARYYPQSNLMSHVVGFSNTEGVGSAGMERRMDARLRGVPGLLVSVRDGAGREMLDRRTLEIPAQKGGDVFLTLDANLQLMVENALDRALETTQSIGAWAIIQNVRTGEILAMASRPDYNPNEYGATPTNHFLNAPIGYTYEPGSTFKVSVIASALNEHTVKPTTVFDCENGCWMHEGRPLHDFHPYGLLSVADIIKKSSNIGAAKVGLTLGGERLERYLRAFGVGRRSGIELPGEEGGIFWSREKWDRLTITRLPMGHGVSGTALQILNIVCAIGNDGFLMKPSVLKRVTDAHGRTLQEFVPVVQGRPIREDTARAMLQIMMRVTEEGGTGRKAVPEGYTVAGKTGTSTKTRPKSEGGGYYDDKNIASFVGVIPAEDPVLGIMVVVDEPSIKEHTGGAIAAPAFREIAQEAVRYLDIPPSGKVEAIDPETSPAEEPETPKESRHVARTSL